MRDLSLHLLDILQNSVVAGADKIEVSLETETDRNLIRLVIRDNGKGMDPDLLARVEDPFVTTRTTRRIGLGIPLLKASAELAGGSLKLDSEFGSGTTLIASFQMNHVDRLPLGDMAGTITGQISSNPMIRLIFRMASNNEEFCLDTVEIRKQLGEVPIETFEVLAWIKEYIDENIRRLFGGVLNEIDC